MNAMYCGEQIKIPEDLGAIMSQFSKAAIRDAPPEDGVYKWAANYFAQLSGQPIPFDDSGRLLSEGGGRKTRTGGSAASGDMVADVMEGAGGFEALDGTEADNTRSAIAELFAHYDTNGSGRLERNELPKLVEDIKANLGIDISKEQVDELLNILDTDEDGTISLDEFQNFIL